MNRCRAKPNVKNRGSLEALFGSKIEPLRTLSLKKVKVVGQVPRF
jgi:hypothetical protein